MGDVVVIAAADDEADEDAEPPLALLQAIWQTGKGVMLLHVGFALCTQASAMCACAWLHGLPHLMMIK